MVAHRTAPRVQETLRGRLYDKIVALELGWLTAERTGGVMWSMVDGGWRRAIADFLRLVSAAVLFRRTLTRDLDREGVRRYGASCMKFS